MDYLNLILVGPLWAFCVAVSAVEVALQMIENENANEVRVGVH